MGERVMEVLNIFMEFFVSFIFLTMFVAVSWGAILTFRDKQAEWEDRKEYNAMKKSIEKNRKKND